MVQIAKEPVVLPALSLQGISLFMVTVTSQMFGGFITLFLPKTAPIDFSRSLVTIREDAGAVDLFAFMYSSLVSIEDLTISFSTKTWNATEGKIVLFRTDNV